MLIANENIQDQKMIKIRRVLLFLVAFQKLHKCDLLVFANIQQK